jgi:acyl-CoA thioesterase YciA
MPNNTNANGDIFGGWIVSQMDLGAGIIAKQRAKCRVTTVAINSMTFIVPVHVGDIISCYATITKVGRTSMTIDVETWRQPVDHSELIKVTEGVFIFVAINDQGRPQPVDRA